MCDPAAISNDGMIVSKLTFPWAKNYNDRFGNQHMHPVSYINAAKTYHSLELERKQKKTC